MSSRRLYSELVSRQIAAFSRQIHLPNRVSFGVRSRVAFNHRFKQPFSSHTFQRGRLSISPELDQDNTNAALSAFPELVACPGCGALAQSIEPDEAGYYSTKRRGVRNLLQDRASVREADPKHDDQIYEAALKTASDEVKQSILPSELSEPTSLHDEADNQVEKLPLCNRCHHLLHHGIGNPIIHPSMDSLADTIAESPYRYNHVYHILDAADFPMSLVPRIHKLLELSPQRSRNRRAKQVRFMRGRLAELSFVITRADLLAPKKEQVDRLMPQLIQTLRDALGRAGRNVRLGNVYCVSATRGWWTREVKADIWKRGGAGWMVGKVNVGKSHLFEAVFPKGRSEDINFDRLRSAARTLVHPKDNVPETLLDQGQDPEENMLLPPARIETTYPMMPTVSSLPGTTASPIRIPFGKGKGELIDLPGLKRSELENLVLPEKRQDLIMKSRQIPEQLTIKPGQSLLLGGLIRITPVSDQDLVMLAYASTKLKAHITATAKAIEMESGERAGPFEQILVDAASTPLRASGVFHLDTDVTKDRAGPLVAKSAVAIKPDQLPFKVLATDILIEGVGWVELVAQVRRHSKRTTSDDGKLYDQEGAAEDTNTPRVEVFSPLGQFISSRRSLGLWNLGSKPAAPSTQRGRPRKSMSGAKKKNQS